MVFDEKNVTGFVNSKYYPFKLVLLLFSIASLGMVIVYLINRNLENVWMVGGTELLIYLLANAISSLIVKNLSSYLKRTILLYVINFILLFCLIFLLFGKQGFYYSDIFPIYAALLISFFISLVLIIIIRKVMDTLKE